MKTVLPVVIATVASILIGIFFVYPNVFSLVRGLFDNSDLGTLAGLVVCFLITGPMIFVATLVVALVAALTDR